MKTNYRNIHALRIVSILVITALLIGFAFLSDALFSDTQNSALVSLRINEILTSNSVYANDDGVICDWVELYNNSEESIDISGYGLSDTELAIYYTFPENTIIEPDGYFVVYCTRDYEGDYYAPFGLSRLGDETISLIHKNKMFIDSVKTRETKKNCPLAYTAGQWIESEYATPGFVNDESGFEAYKQRHAVKDCTVRISEAMSSNQSVLACADGSFCDWVELTNYGEDACDLSGYYLSDSESDLLGWKLPHLILEPGEIRVVFASGRGTSVGEELHANFSISSEGETICLSTPFGELIDSMTCPMVEDNRSAVLADSGENVDVTEYPTPGFANSDAGYEQFAATLSSRGAVEISEVCASNQKYLAQQDGQCYDWIELHNVSDASVSLSGWSLSDAMDGRYGALPDVTLAPDGYYIVICSGDAGLSDANYIHLGFTLSAEDENVYLFLPDGSLCDYINVHDVPYDGSCGRVGGLGGCYYFTAATPGAANGSGALMKAQKPSSQTASGSYAASELTLQLSGQGDIYYTLDGAVPDKNDQLYSQPIAVSETSVVRAVCIEQGKLPSDALTLSLILDAKHELPVVSLSCAPEDMFGANGIYDNVDRSDIERLCNVTILDNGAALSVDCGITLHGSGSRQSCDKKSFELKFRGRYDGSLNYDIFGDGEVVSFSSLVLRSGEDYRYAVIRDELCTSLAGECSDSTLVQKYRYCVLYINGEYFGVYAIREDLSDSYYASHYAVDPKSVVMARANAEYNSQALYSIMQFASRSDLSDMDNYNAVISKIDVDSFIDWAIFEAYFKNTDVAGNIKYFISTENGNRWQIALFDLDWSMYKAADMRGVMNYSEEQSILFDALFQNSEFTDRFLTRMADLLENDLTKRNVLERIDELTDELDSEMERDCARWGRTKKDWINEVNELKKSVTSHDRAQELIDSICNYVSISDEQVAAYFE